MEKNIEKNTNTELDDISVQRNYKDTVFRMIFKDKKELLALYNAINGTHYNNVDVLKVKTLENAIYMTVKNDVSFVIDTKTLNIYEHQSTVNPHMPIRDLDYVTKNFAEYYEKKDLYSSTKKVSLPNPRFLVFYNGKGNEPPRKELKLSDFYEIKEDNPQLELIVTQININPGYNDDLLDKCKTLYEYSMFVETTRKYEKDYPYEIAINLSIDECIEKGILADFLRKNRAEVVRMSIFEYNAKLHEDTLKEDSKEEGRKEGRQEGKIEERANGIATLISTLKELNIPDNQIIDQVVNKYGLTSEDATEKVKKHD